MKIGRSSLVNLYNQLITTTKSNEFFNIWLKFKEISLKDFNSKTPIPEIALLPRNIETMYGNINKENISILNHGSGSGFPDLYWISLGYTNLLSFDLYDKNRAKLYVKLNKFLKRNKVIKKDVFHVYDGKKLPLANGTTDVIVSNAVIEHLPDETYEMYFIEEERVLRDGGFCLHVIPQRFQPYDSHTRTWFIHWFPRQFHVSLIKMFGIYNPNLTLVLRTRTTHLRNLKYIGKVEDKSLNYFMNTKIKKDDFLDGKKSRGIFFFIITLPILKYFFPILLKPLMVLITITKKDN